MNSEYDSGVEDVRDHTKWLWIGIAASFAVMVAAMAIWGGVKSDQSQVVVRHILIKCDFADAEDTARARHLAEDLRERILAGEDFATLARNYSQDPSSSSRGGSLPAAPPKTYEDAFDAYVWAAPVGEVSNLVQTGYGYHIIQVLRRDMSVVDEYDQEIRERVYEEMRNSGQNPETEAGQAQ